MLHQQQWGWGLPVALGPWQEPAAEQLSLLPGQLWLLLERLWSQESWLLLEMVRSDSTSLVSTSLVLTSLVLMSLVSTAEALREPSLPKW